jgi:DNA-binding transcriptional MerR regulator
MTIGQFAKLSAVSPDTLRYYEKVNLVRRIDRDKAGRRVFCQEDLVWIQFIKRLKETGMSLAEIIRYADLREKGNATIQARYELLKKHAAVLTDRMAADQKNLDMLREKMAFYKKEMNRKKSS